MSLPNTCASHDLLTQYMPVMQQSQLDSADIQLSALSTDSSQSIRRYETAPTVEEEDITTQHMPVRKQSQTGSPNIQPSFLSTGSSQQNRRHETALTFEEEDIGTQYNSVMRRRQPDSPDVQPSILLTSVNQLDRSEEDAPTAEEANIGQSLYEKPWVIPAVSLEIWQIFVLTCAVFYWSLGPQNIPQYFIFMIWEGFCFHPLYTWGFIWASSIRRPLLVPHPDEPWSYMISAVGCAVLSCGSFLFAILETDYWYAGPLLFLLLVFCVTVISVVLYKRKRKGA